MSRCVASGLMLVFTMVAFVTLGRAPGAVNFRSRDLEMQPRVIVEADELP